jgi:nucleoside-diphosphate-sugar epimerase
MPLRIALTGATGFVGKTLIPKLLAAGHLVRALVRDPSRATLPTNVETIQGSLADQEALKKLVQGCDVVLHVAGAISGLTPDDFMKANFHGTNAIALATKQQGIKRFVYVSSLAATEPELGPYGKSKAIAEQSLKVIFSQDQLLILRPCAIYGPGDTATLPLLQALMSDTAVIPGMRGNRFSMIHVEDLANILAETASGNATGTFELDDTEGGHSWPELIALTQKHFGKPKRSIYIPRGVATLLGHGGDMIASMRRKQSMVNSNQIRQLYHENWTCAEPGWPRSNAIPLKDGLPQTIRWYQAQGLLPMGSSVDTSSTHQSDQAET